LHKDREWQVRFQTPRSPRSRSPAPGSLTADELKDHVRANLARYRVPRDVMLVSELPRNATGKVLKRTLARD
jgi:acyl-coenzyme A synthetase/AMP-(fatty) acid ligase